MVVNIFTPPKLTDEDVMKFIKLYKRNSKINSYKCRLTAKYDIIYGPYGSLYCASNEIGLDSLTIDVIKYVANGDETDSQFLQTFTRDTLFDYNRLFGGLIKLVKKIDNEDDYAFVIMLKENGEEKVIEPSYFERNTVFVLPTNSKTTREIKLFNDGMGFFSVNFKILDAGVIKRTKLHVTADFGSMSEAKEFIKKIITAPFHVIVKKFLPWIHENNVTKLEINGPKVTIHYSSARKYAVIHGSVNRKTITLRNVPYAEGLYTITFPKDINTDVIEVFSISKLPRAVKKRRVVGTGVAATAEDVVLCNGEAIEDITRSITYKYDKCRIFISKKGKRTNYAIAIGNNWKQLSREETEKLLYYARNDEDIINLLSLF